MGSYRIEVRPAASEEFWDVPFPQRRLLNGRMVRLKNDPRPSEAEKIGDREDYRLSVGGWVMIYGVDDAREIVTVYGFRAGPPDASR